MTKNRDFLMLEIKRCEALARGADLWQDKGGCWYIMPNKVFSLEQCKNLVALVEIMAEKYGLAPNLRLVKA